MKRKLLILFGIILFLASINLEVRYLRGADAWLADSSTRRQKITTQVANIDSDLTWYPLQVEVIPGDTPVCTNNSIKTIFSPQHVIYKEFAVSVSDILTVYSILVERYCIVRHNC